LAPQLNPDVNPFQRSFVGEIRRIEEMTRRVNFFAAQIERENDPVPIRPLYDSAPLIAVGPGAAQTMDDLDDTLGGHESRLLEMNAGYELLSGRLAELIEARHVLRETAVFFQRVRGSYLPWPRPNHLDSPCLGRIKSERDPLII
jgi:V-type H+-transporting ATPase subunit a